VIIGCLIFYNDPLEMLDRALASLREAGVDWIVAVDGAFERHPHSHDASGKPVRDLVRSKVDVYLDTPHRAWDTEIEKRNMYLVGTVGDVYVVLDSDEELKGNLSYAYQDSLGWQVRLEQEGLADRPVWRVFRHFEGIHYYGTHHAVCLGVIPLNHLVVRTLPEAWIKHYTNDRSNQRKQDKGVYLRDLSNQERQFRERWRL